MNFGERQNQEVMIFLPDCHALLFGIHGRLWVRLLIHNKSAGAAHRICSALLDSTFFRYQESFAHLFLLYSIRFQKYNRLARTNCHIALHYNNRRRPGTRSHIPRNCSDQN